MGTPNCKEGYSGIMCSECADGFFAMSDDTRKPCANLGSGGQNQQYMFYGMVGGMSVLTFFFLLYLYMRRDDGAAVMKRARRCCGCYRRTKHMMHWEGRKKKDHSSYVHEAQANMWFRPEKFKILLSFVQLFSSMKNNYDVPWSSATAEYMRYFAGFNIDIVKVAAVDCLYKTNFYLGLLMVCAVPVLGALLLFVVQRCGRMSFRSQLRNMPRKCVRSGEPVTAPMPSRYYHKLRREAAKKSLLADDIPDEKQKITTRRGLKRATGHNITGLPPGSSILPQFFDKPGVIDAAHLDEVLKHNITQWKRRLVERMEYMRFTNKCLKLLFWMLLLTYPSVTVRTLRTFKCREVGGHRVLDSDMAIECSGSVHLRYQLFALITGGVFIVGVPTLFLAMLIKARENGVKKIWRTCERFPKRKDKLLKEAHEDAKAQGRFWTLDKDGDGEHTDREVKDAILYYLRQRNMRFHRTYQRLGFIYYSYRESCWWYEVVELNRKLILNGAIVLLGGGQETATTIVGGLVVCFAFIVLLNYVQPYNCQSAFLLQNICHVQLFLTALCGLLLKVGVKFLGFGEQHREGEQKIVETLVISSHALTLVFAVGSVIWEKFFSHEVRRHMARQEKAINERKQRMAKWNRAKKAVLLGVRGGMGMGLALGASSATPASPPASGMSALLGSLGVSKKKADSKTKIEPQLPSSSGESKSGLFDFPDDERQINTPDANTAAETGAYTDAESEVLDLVANLSSESSASDSSGEVQVPDSGPEAIKNGDAAQNRPASDVRTTHVGANSTNKSSSSSSSSSSGSSSSSSSSSENEIDSEDSEDSEGDSTGPAGKDESKQNHIDAGESKAAGSQVDASPPEAADGVLKESGDRQPTLVEAKAPQPTKSTVEVDPKVTLAQTRRAQRASGALDFSSSTTRNNAAAGASQAAGATDFGWVDSDVSDAESLMSSDED